MTLEQLTERRQELGKRIRYLRHEVLSSRGKLRLSRALAAGDEDRVTELRAESENAKSEVTEIRRSLKVLDSQIKDARAELADEQLPDSREAVNAAVSDYMEAAQRAIAAGRELQRAYVQHRSLASQSKTYPHRATIPPRDCEVPSGIPLLILQLINGHTS